MDEPNKVNKPLQIAKSLNADVQKLVNTVFEASEATAALKASDPDIYFLKSNQIFSAFLACISQRMLTDGLMRRKLYGKTSTGLTLAWELFLDNNPEIAKKIADEKAAKEAKYASQVSHDEGDEPEDDGDEDESGDEE